MRFISSVIISIFALSFAGCEGVNEKSRDNNVMIDSTKIFQIDSLIFVKALPGDISGEIDYFEYQYTVFENGDKYDYSLIVQCISDTFRIINSGKYFTPAKAFTNGGSEHIMAFGNTVSLKGFIDIDRNGFYEIVIYQTRKGQGGDCPTFWSHGYHDISNNAGNCVWRTGGCGWGC